MYSKRKNSAENVERKIVFNLLKVTTVQNSCFGMLVAYSKLCWSSKLNALMELHVVIMIM